jgi:phosphohistidine swiveling domain-containing protein
MTLIASFNQPDLGHTSLVGGKGANLIALTAAGFPVPTGFIVTAAAYPQFLATIEWLDAAIHDFDYAHPDRLHDQCAALRQRLTAMPLPLELQTEVRAALSRLAPDTAYAVRSSSTFEDLAQAAFAGQHDTYLNIRTPDAILDRIRACFASLWEDRAVLYRDHQGFIQRDARMAVVVQQQIESHSAGVGFSIDPVNGSMDKIVINANFGLGESVVSGQCEVDQFVLDKPHLTIAQRHIGHKTVHILAALDGTTESSVPAHLADQPSLSDQQLTSIAQLLQRIEAHYGWPQDIEWGIHEDRLYLFQSRPVTTLQPRWTRDESAERFPNPMTPLSWDFISVAFRRSLRHSMSLMGLPPLKGDWFQIFDHFIYGNQNAVRLLAMYRPLRARSLPDLVAEIPDLRKRFAWVLDLPVAWARDLDRYLIRLGRLDATPAPPSLADAWKFVNDVLDTASDYFLPNIAISMTQSGLHRLLHGLIALAIGPEKALPILDALLTACETKTTLINRELYELATLSKGNSILRAELLEKDSRDSLARLAQFPDFAARFHRFLEDHGHREVDMDYSVPTWSGQPAVVLDSIALILRGNAEDPADTMRQQRIRFADTEQQFLAAVPEQLRFFFRELIRLARSYTILDDLEHYHTTRINPLAHRAALQLGDQLVPLHALDIPADIFFLNKSDLEAFIADPSPARAIECHAKAIANKASYEKARLIPPRWSLDETPAPPTDDSATTLRGLPGSPGRATGPAFRIRSSDDFKRFPAGAVLVAPTTNPAWTALFYSAIAVVTESGGPLSHGAVTAREMNLPAVMSVRGIMSRITDGQILTVDGSQGTVSLTAT